LLFRKHKKECKKVTQILHIFQYFYPGKPHHDRLPASSSTPRLLLLATAYIAKWVSTTSLIFGHVASVVAQGQGNALHPPCELLSKRSIGKGGATCCPEGVSFCVYGIGDEDGTRGAELVGRRYKEGFV
jgi:hypothetical protein